MGSVSVCRGPLNSEPSLTRGFWGGSHIGAPVVSNRRGSERGVSLEHCTPAPDIRSHRQGRASSLSPVSPMLWGGWALLSNEHTEIMDSSCHAEQSGNWSK